MGRVRPLELVNALIVHRSSMSAESRLDQVRQVSTHEYSHPSASIVAVRRIPTTTRNSRVLTHSLAIVRMRSFVKGYIVSRYSEARKAGQTSTSPYCRSAWMLRVRNKSGMNGSYLGSYRNGDTPVQALVSRAKPSPGSWLANWPEQLHPIYSVL